MLMDAHMLPNLDRILILRLKEVLVTGYTQ